MNQAILLNDDHHYDTAKQRWVFTGMLSGEHIMVVVDSTLTQQSNITDAIKFDWEILVEEWLESNEPPINGEIHVLSK
jgi:hypothetical protein